MSPVDSNSPTLRESNVKSTSKQLFADAVSSAPGLCRSAMQLQILLAVFNLLVGSKVHVLTQKASRMQSTDAGPGLSAGLLSGSLPKTLDMHARGCRLYV